jgi:DNA-binding LacI/PurR family transcriptional regulator
MQDQWVPDVIEAIYRCGLRFPEDVALATIGDDVQVSVGGTGLTAAHCDWDGFADLALDALLDRMSGSLEPARRLLAGHMLVVHGLGEFGNLSRRDSGYALVTVRQP